jgi:hypothetical protein
MTLPQSPSLILSLHLSESTTGNLNATWNGNLNTPRLYLEVPSNLQSPPSLVLIIPYLSPTLTVQHLQQHPDSQPCQRPELMALHPWNWTSISPFAPDLEDPLPKRRNNRAEISISATIAAPLVTTSRLVPFVPLDLSHPNLSKFMSLK